MKFVRRMSDVRMVVAGFIPAGLLADRQTDVACSVELMFYEV